MGLRNCLIDSLPFAAMVMMECLDVGMTTLSKAAMTRGMSHFVFVVYSNALASLILLPSSFFINRHFSPFFFFFKLTFFPSSNTYDLFSIVCRSKRLPLSFSLLCKFFLLSLIGYVPCIYILITHNHFQVRNLFFIFREK